jgi:hypothetical protein
MIYIQSNSDKTMPHHFDCACARYGAIEDTIPYRFTSFDEVKRGRFDLDIKKNLFVGSVEFMREVFNRVGIHDIRLPKNSNREHKISTLKEAHECVAAGEKLFIKPFEIKLFTGLVLDGCQYACLDGLPEDTKVMAYKPFNSPIITEWRVYIDNGEIEDIRNYSGDVMLMPDKGYIEEVIEKDCQFFPKVYTIDVAILEDGSHQVVEFNDMWAIGNYGVPNYIYVELLKKRYFEIVG